MNDLPAARHAVAALADSQSPQVRAMFHYALAMRVDTERAQVVGNGAGDDTEHYPDPSADSEAT